MVDIRNSELRVPSGFEVESASQHMPGGPDWQPMEHDLKSKMDELKVRGMDAVRSMKQTMATRSTSMRDMMMAKTSGMQRDMRSNPAKWAGIMTGAGIGLGLVGRYLRHRMKRNRVPRLVIIEAC